MITEESGFTVIMTVTGLVTGGIGNFISVVLIIITIVAVIIITIVTVIVVILVWIGNGESKVVETA